MKQTYFFAVRTAGSWDSHKQTREEFNTWTEAVAHAYKLAVEAKSETRISTSFGYNNQGHYFHHQNAENFYYRLKMEVA